MSVERWAGLLRQQAGACAELGSPMYAALLGRAADDVLTGGPTADVVTGHDEATVDSAHVLRLMGAVHRLALAGEAPDVARHLPSCGGDGDVEGAWRAVRDLLRERTEDVRAGLATPPQTNEVGRAAPLLGALLQVLLRYPLPVRLWEIGTSGGLNLRADRFTYGANDGGTWGPASAVVLDPAWDVVPPDVPAVVDVVERVGGDVAPVDPTTPEGALRLQSFVWPDQLERLRRLRGAIRVASECPARLVAAGAADLLTRLEPVEGTLTVLWHSVMWHYLDDDERARVSGRLASLGGAASARAPFADIAFEPRVTLGETRFTVTARTWPGGEGRALGTAPPHGMPVTWA